jgi:hypothetical protein
MTPERGSRSLADRDGFIVVYGKGLPDRPSPREVPAVPEGGFLQGCLLRQSDEDPAGLSIFGAR